MRERATAAAYTAGWTAVRRVPEPLARAAADATADLLWRQGGRGVRRLEDNLARVLPPGTPVAPVVRAAMRSYLRYWREVFRLPETPPQDLLERTRMVDEDRLAAGVASGEGVVLALPHMANWDWAGAWAVARGYRFTTVAERLRPEELFDRFVAFRESLGMEVLPLTGGRRPPYGLLAERLRSGGLLCLLADRDLTATGLPVRFFGGTARMPRGPAALACETGAWLMPVTLWYEDRGLVCRIHERIRPQGRDDDVATMTQAVADAFAEGIAAHPQDWHMLQRVWVDDGVAAAGTPR